MNNNKRLTRSQSSLVKNLTENIKHIADKIEEKNVKILAKQFKKVSIEANENLNTSSVTSVSKNLIGRQNEVHEIQNFLMENIKNSKNGNLYISGPPGTGKTLVISEVLSHMASQKLCKYHFINCMDFKSPEAVYRDLLEKLTSKRVTNTARAAKEVEEYLKSRKSDDRPLVVVLDEIDQLLSVNSGVLYRIFGWAQLAVGCLSTIGIANSLDLTERMLPDLALQLYRPSRISFRPYNDHELASIITGRADGPLTVEQTQAVRFVSKKISAKSGDARAAIDLYKRAGELALLEDMDQARCQSCDTLTDTLTMPDMPTTPTKQHSTMAVPRTPQTLPRRKTQLLTPLVASSPNIKHVNRAINEAERAADPFRNIINMQSGKSTLPLHQQLALCAGLVLSKHQTGTNHTKHTVVIGSLYDKYVDVCECQSIEPIDMSNFVDLVSHLESRGLAKLTPHKDSRRRIFTMNLDQTSVERALEDKALVTKILQKFMPE